LLFLVAVVVVVAVCLFVRCAQLIELAADSDYWQLRGEGAVESGSVGMARIGRKERQRTSPSEQSCCCGWVDEHLSRTQCTPLVTRYAFRNLTKTNTTTKTTETDWATHRYYRVDLVR